MKKKGWFILAIILSILFIVGLVLLLVFVLREDDEGTTSDPPEESTGEETSTQEETSTEETSTEEDLDITSLLPKETFETMMGSGSTMGLFRLSSPSGAFVGTLNNTNVLPNGVTEFTRDDLISRGLADKPFIEWYYTYDNFVAAVRENPLFAKFGSAETRKKEIAAFFAHFTQETGSGGAFQAGNFIQELNRPYNDTAYGANSNGVGFFGRGPLQLSYEHNYRKYGEATFNGDLYVNDPEILIRNPIDGIGSALYYWCAEQRVEEGCSGIPGNPAFKPSCHEVITGQWTPTENDIDANRTLASDFGVTINIINGGIECGTEVEQALQQAQNRVNYYKAYLQLLGVDVTLPDDAILNCSQQKNFSENPTC